MNEHDAAVIDRGLVEPDGPPAELYEAADEVEAKPADRLDEIRAKLARVRDLRIYIAQCKEWMVEANKEIQELQFQTLPEMFVAGGVRQLTLEAEGNLPPYESEIKPYYHASISTEWEPQQRDNAFALLQQREASDLIKSKITVELDRGDLPTARLVMAKLDEMKVPYAMTMAVHWRVLTTWVKEQYEKKLSFTPGELDTIGARVATIVEVKARKEDS
jgi:hypothetical protein